MCSPDLKIYNRIEYVWRKILQTTFVVHCTNVQSSAKTDDSPPDFDDN